VSAQPGPPGATASRAQPAAVGLPPAVRACLFDLDGVITRTAVVHEAAWREMFDGWLAERARQTGEPLLPFRDEDYTAYLDGRSRTDGIRAFLGSRAIRLPDGDPDDGPGAQTVQGLGVRKDRLLQQRLRRDGVEVYPDSAGYLDAVRAAGLRTAVVSSSANTSTVLEVTGLAGRFDTQVDALVARTQRLHGKPAPDMFLCAAAALGLTADRAAVFEDAEAGVAAGHAGGFALVVGIDRSAPGSGHAEALKDHGADLVVRALTELTEHSAPTIDR
jgi:beta-phosphoglucomutase family hydrolase